MHNKYENILLQILYNVNEDYQKISGQYYSSIEPSNYHTKYIITLRMDYERY